MPEFERECYELSILRNTYFPEGFSASELFSLISSLSKPNLRMLNVAKLLRKAGILYTPIRLSSLCMLVGYKTCVLTNNWIDDKLEVPFSMLKKEFDVVIESCKVGVRKPDPLIYKLACDKLQVQPSQVLIIINYHDHNITTLIGNIPR